MTIPTRNGELWRLNALMRSTSRGFDLDSPIASATWTAPNLASIRDDCLVIPQDANPNDVRPGVGMLEGFLRLHRGNDDDIANYATRWGPLYVCAEHMLPPWHPGNDDCYGLQIDGASATPLALWRHWSRSAFALLALAVALRSENCGEEEDWQAIGDETVDSLRRELWQRWPYSPPHRDQEGHLYVVPLPPYAHSLLKSNADYRQGVRAGVRQRYGPAVAISMARNDLAAAIQEWISLGAVTPRFRWPPAGPEIVMSGSSLFGALGVQIMMAASRSDGLMLCTACGQPYVPSRRAAPHRRHYCPNCREDGAAIRDASADYRTRKKGA